MSLTPSEVARLAHLARLQPTPAEQQALLATLNGFFDHHVAPMGAVDTTGVEPLYTPLAAVQAMPLRLREDAVTEVVDRNANQASAPAVQDGLYLVPRVIE
ncbi:MAG: Asp-tRNA(Asn)/Glu-tRNA(Gln) amidotransferase subunit GatC [Rubrivivax sp.]|jgi:aspartyl-tRNA(Asn)/glutamyl-tRNA(Gln) amidotransferase subunit C|nr:Asp-tRNA(Asn)/Glu-tRNA(Gln) amidotransferase subunit GatC [Rubrivivax sp.]